MVKRRSCNSTQLEKGIYFFTPFQNPSVSYLKEYLKFLKALKVPNHLNFSFVEKEGRLLSNLSFLDYFTLNSFYKDSNSQNTLEKFKEKLKETQNSFLFELFLQLGDLSEIPTSHNLEKQKIVAILKSFLISPQYLLMDSVEYNLNKKNFSTLKMAIKKHMAENNTTIILTSPNQSLWEDTASKVISMIDAPKKNYLIKSFISRPQLEISRNNSNNKKHQEHLMFYKITSSSNSK